MRRYIFRTGWPNREEFLRPRRPRLRAPEPLRFVSSFCDFGDFIVEFFLIIEKLMEKRIF